MYAVSGCFREFLGFKSMFMDILYWCTIFFYCIEVFFYQSTSFIIYHFDFFIHIVFSAFTFLILNLLYLFCVFFFSYYLSYFVKIIKNNYILIFEIIFFLTSFSVYLTSESLVIDFETQ